MISTFTKQIFESNPVVVPSEGFCIRPSSISQFFRNPSDWYYTYLDKPPDNYKFSSLYKEGEGNILGSVLHYIYEQVMLGKNISKKEINEAIDYYCKDKEKIDTNIIKELYQNIAPRTINTFILNNVPSKGILIEKQGYTLIKDNVYVGGRLDLFYSNTVHDWKNVSKKPTNLEYISSEYKYQLLAYAYILRKLGYTPRHIQIGYSVRPTKTLDSRFYLVNEFINDTYWDEIESILSLIADSIIKVKNNKDEARLIFKLLK